MCGDVAAAGMSSVELNIASHRSHVISEMIDHSCGAAEAPNGKRNIINKSPAAWMQHCIAAQKARWSRQYAAFQLVFAITILSSGCFRRK